MVLKIVLIVLVVVALIILFLHSIKICEGGKIMQGCGRLLFPWTKKYKIKGFNSYCCEECFMRDYKLLATKRDVDPYNLNFNTREELDGIERDNDD